MKKVIAIEIRPEGTFIEYDDKSSQEIPIQIIKVFMNTKNKPARYWKVSDLLDVIEGLN